MRHVYASTSGMPRQRLAATLDECDAVGLGRIELSSGAGEGDPLEAVLNKHAGMEFLIHNYFPAPADPFVLNLADQDPDVLRKSIALCEQAIQLSATVRAPFYSVHAGFRATFDPQSLGKTLQYGHVWEYNQSYDTFIQSIEHLLAFGSERGVALLVEPNVLAPFNLTNGRNEVALICEPAEVPRLMNDINSAQLGLLLDTGHLKVTARALGYERSDFIAAAEPFIRAFHVHDNDGNSDQHLPVEEGSWVLEILRRADFVDLPIVDEAKFDSVRDMLDHVNWLQENVSSPAVNGERTV